MAQLSDIKPSITQMGKDEATALVVRRRQSRQELKVKHKKKVTVTTIESYVDKMDDSQMEEFEKILEKSHAASERKKKMR